MSDTEPLDLRQLPALEPVEPPARFSQTFLRHADDCRRSAYLYLKYRGGTPGHALDRGSLGHAVFERMTWTVLEQGDAAFLDPDEFAAIKTGQDPGNVAGRIASVTAAIVDEVARERPDLPVPIEGIDSVRVMAYHWAVGMQLPVQHIVAVERKFVLDIAGWEITGKIDLAYLDGQVAGVDDYKTGVYMPDQEAFDESFQTKLYAALIAFGQPLKEEPCPDCEGHPRWEIEGRTVETRDPLELQAVYDAEQDRIRCVPCETCADRGSIEVREESLGRGVQHVRCRELYPFRDLFDDGGMARREKVRSRTDLADFVADLERLVIDVERRLTSGDWPARPGSHCSKCPCKPECPLPAHVRAWAGAIDSVDEAREMAEAWDRAKDENSSLQKELRNWLKDNGGRLRYGKDKVLVLEAESSKVTDWPGLEAGVEAAREYGEPFELAMFRKQRSSTRLKDKTLSPDELEDEVA